MPAQIGNTQAQKWVPEHDDALKRLRSEGYSSSQIASELWGLFRMSYSRNAVIGRAHRLGLTDPIARRGPKRVAERVAKPKRRSHGPIIQKFNAEEVILRCVEIVPRNLSLMELEPNDCRYPYGDDFITFCGHPKGEGSSYCVPHHTLCLKPLHGNMGRERQDFSAVLRKRSFSASNLARFEGTGV